MTRHRGDSRWWASGGGRVRAYPPPANLRLLSDALDGSACAGRDWLNVDPPPESSKEPQIV